jgi:RNA polymerase sigma factor (sigma-70 family)
MQDQSGAHRARIAVIALAVMAGVLGGAPLAHASASDPAELSPRLLAEASWHGRPIRRPLPAREAAAFRQDRAPQLRIGTGFTATGGSERVRRLQRRLLRLGYRPGSSDGLFGPRTQAALIAFQRKHGLEQTGGADAVTLHVLRVRTIGRSSGDGTTATTLATDAPAPERPSSAAPEHPGAQSAPATDTTPRAGGGSDRASLAATLAAILLAAAVCAVLLRRRAARRPGGSRRLPTTRAVGATEAGASSTPLPAPRDPALARVIGYMSASRSDEGGAAAPDHAGRADAWELESVRIGGVEQATRPSVADREHDAEIEAPAARAVRRLSPQERAALRERIRWMREEGMTLQAIADQLNVEGTPTLGGRDFWRPSNVRAAVGPSRSGNPAEPASEPSTRKDVKSGRRDIQGEHTMEIHKTDQVHIEAVEARSRGDDLVARCRGGDPTAWPELVRRFAPYVHAVAVRAHGLADADAQEVFHEVFLRTWAELEHLGGDAALRRLVVELARDLSRERTRMLAGDPKPVAADLLETLDDALEVSEALGELTPAEQEVVHRFFVEGQAPRTIAQALGMPEGSVARRIRRARRIGRMVAAGRRKGEATITPP